MVRFETRVATLREYYRRHVGVTAVLVGLASALPVPVHAQALHAFCAAAKKNVDADFSLSEAVTAAFGHPLFSSTADECIYPLKTLRYADADVLLTIGNVPGQACHGCAANLTAYVLRRAAGELKLFKTLVDFASAGTFGDPGKISQVGIGGDDGIAIESGGMFQGHSYGALDLYVFRSGRAIRLKAEPELPWSASNEGAMTDDAKIIDVTASWAIDPSNKGRLSVDYKVQARGRSRVDRTVWQIAGDRLRLIQGSIPRELGAAGRSE